MEKRSDKKTGKGKQTTTKFRRQFQADYKPYIGEINNGKSETVPSMNLSVTQLLKNHSRGIYSDVKQHEGQYFETEIPHFDDITDMLEYKADLIRQKEELEEKIQEENKAIRTKKKAAMEAKDLKVKKAAEISSKEQNIVKEKKIPEELKH